MCSGLYVTTASCSSFNYYSTSTPQHDVPTSLESHARFSEDEFIEHCSCSVQHTACSVIGARPAVRPSRRKGNKTWKYVLAHNNGHYHYRGLQEVGHFSYHDAPLSELCFFLFGIVVEHSRKSVQLRYKHRITAQLPCHSEPVGNHLCDGFMKKNGFRGTSTSYGHF